MLDLILLEQIHWMHIHHVVCLSSPMQSFNLSWASTWPGACKHMTLCIECVHPWCPFSSPHPLAGYQLSVDMGQIYASRWFMFQCVCCNTWLEFGVWSFWSLASACMMCLPTTWSEYFKWSPRTQHSRMSLSEWNLGTLSVGMTQCLGFRCHRVLGQKFRVRGCQGCWWDRVSVILSLLHIFQMELKSGNPEISPRQECSLNRGWE